MLTNLSSPEDILCSERPSSKFESTMRRETSSLWESISFLTGLMKSGNHSSLTSLQEEETRKHNLFLTLKTRKILLIGESMTTKEQLLTLYIKSRIKVTADHAGLSLPSLPLNLLSTSELTLMDLFLHTLSNSYLTVTMLTEHAMEV
jgi:hypothetical protein